MPIIQSGPFTFETVGRSITINGEDAQCWAMFYANRRLAEKTLRSLATQNQVKEAFIDNRTAFIRSHQRPAAQRENLLSHGYRVRLVQSTETTGSHGKQLSEFLALAPIEGICRGLIDDRFPTWLVSELGCTPMNSGEFERLRVAHSAIADALQRGSTHTDDEPPYAWVADLLPEEVTTRNHAAWRAPTNIELRHVVGEESFTSVSATKAAELVGIMPQNFRKYMARDGAASHQKISFAMWHLLLHKLGVQAA